jgi:signal transduction histidine kinase
MATTREFVRVPEIMAGEDDKLTDYFDFAYWTSGQQPVANHGSSFRHVRSLDPGFPDITLAVGLREAGLLRLAPGGLPRNRGLEFLALFTLAGVLVACSMLLLRREEQLARTRANFVAGVSHELRTPLAQIRMFAEMLLLGRVRSETDRRRSLEIIDTEARRLSHLVENVLQAARSENGHLHVNPATMRVAPIIRECVETFSVLAQARSMDFRTELQDDLVAHVDSAALRQIVLNLLDNAAKYGPDGQRVVVGVALFDDAARIWVDDEGAGIPVRERQRVFDPFYRSREAQGTTGSGIGLSVVRELAALHGGSAWIEDAPDAGTRVVVQFPGAFLAEAATGDFAVA